LTTPKALRPSALGCREEATQGLDRKRGTSPEGVAPIVIDAQCI
jgi:hypothetical protein